MEQNRWLTIVAIIILIAIAAGAAVMYMQQQEAEEPADLVPQPTVTLSPSPSPTDDDLFNDDEEATEEADEDANIQVSTPDEGDEVSLPLVVTGIARVFENVVEYRVEDSTGQVLAEGNTMATAPDVGEFGPFIITIDEWDNQPESSEGTVTVYSSSARDGSEINVVEIPVSFVEAQ